MPCCDSEKFGPIEFDSGSVIEFPRGLPGFDRRRQFLPVSIKATQPIIYLQSLDDPGLCFITLPILAVDPAYRLEVTDEDLEEIGLPAGSTPVLGPEVLCLAVLAVREEAPTANLLAPVVVNLANKRAVQAIAPHARYLPDHALPAQSATAC